MSRHADRQAIAREFGATDVVAERGDEGVERVQDLLGGIGADAVLECVGTKESMEQALRHDPPGRFRRLRRRPGRRSGAADRPMFSGNLNVAGGVAPVRAYLPELLAEVLDGTIDPGRVFDLEVPLDDVAEAYAAMDERRAVKSLLRP